jgi:hypothetical protein
MQTGNISFCEKQAINIKSDKIKKELLDKLNTYNVNILHKHYEIFNDNSVVKIKKSPYIISLKSNGNPYLMFLTRINHIPTCLMIDKKIQQGYFLPRIIVIHMSFDDILFDDTIFDGEMIKDKNSNWIYMINDVYALNGNALNDHNIVKRLNSISNILMTNYIPDEQDIFSIQMKKYYKCSEVNEMVDTFQKTLPYTSRGIIFKPMFLKFKDILHNFNNSLITNTVRKKVGNMNEFIDKSNLLNTTHGSNNIHNKNDEIIQTMKYTIIKTDVPDVYDLYDNEKNIGNACVNTLSVSKFLRNLFESSNVNTKFVVKCVYNSKFHKWIPIELS